MIHLRNPKRIKLFYGYSWSGYHSKRNIWTWYVDVNYSSNAPLVIHFFTRSVFSFGTFPDYQLVFMDKLNAETKSNK